MLNSTKFSISLLAAVIVPVVTNVPAQADTLSASVGVVYNTAAQKVQPQLGIKFQANDSISINGYAKLGKGDRLTYSGTYVAPLSDTLLTLDQYVNSPSSIVNGTYVPYATYSNNFRQGTLEERVANAQAIQKGDFKQSNAESEITTYGVDATIDIYKGKEGLVAIGGGGLLNNNIVTPYVTATGAYNVTNNLSVGVTVRVPVQRIEKLGADIVGNVQYSF
jgi:hypothetical protein